MSKNNKIPYIHIIPVVAIGIILYKIIDNIGIFGKGIVFFISLLVPFIWAFGISYLLNPLMMYFERKFKMKRWQSLAITFIIFIGILSFTLGIIIPKLIDSLKQIVLEVPEYTRKTKDFIDKQSGNIELYQNSKIASYIENNLTQLLEKMANQMESWVNVIITKVINFTSGFFKFVIGILLSIYMLKDKEKIIRGIKRLIYASIGNDKGESLLSYCKEADKVFSSYIIGKTIDSAIMGILCFIVLEIMRVPYAILISIIFGVTNMIPYFGPFIGTIAGAIIVVFSNPMLALWVLIALFLLQQFDGWVLGPKILGDAVGLSPLWIIFAIIVGGGLYGVFGMFLGVPFVAIIKIWVDRIIEKRLE